MVHVHRPADDLAEHQERHGQQLHRQPQRGQPSTGERPDHRRSGGQPRISAGPSCACRARSRRAACRRGAEAPHLVPPHRAQEVDTGRQPSTTRGDVVAVQPVGGPILLDGHRMPDEVEPLAGGVAVVHRGCGRDPRPPRRGHSGPMHTWAIQPIGSARLDKRTVRTRRDRSRTAQRHRVRPTATGSAAPTSDRSAPGRRAVRRTEVRPGAPPHAARPDDRR